MISVTHILYLSEKGGQNPFSGAENHVITLVRSLHQRGVDVELVVLLWHPGETIAKRLGGLEKEGVRLHVIERDVRWPWKGRLWRALECWTTLYKMLRDRRGRIIHLHLDLIAAVTVARLAGCRRLVLSIHNDEPYYAMYRWRVWLKIIDRWVVQYIAITDHVRSYYARNARIAQSKIVTIYYGVEPPLRQPGAREMFGIAPERFVVGFIGRLTRQKNVEILIQAAARMPQVDFVIVGVGERYRILRGQVTVRGLRNVRFLGAVPHAASLMPLFDVFCLPSLWEGLGLVLIEAMLHGVPIVGSDAGAIPEILQNGRCGLIFDRTSCSSLIEKLMYAVSHRHEMSVLAKRGFERATNEFRVDRMTTRTIELYRTVDSAAV